MGNNNNNKKHSYRQRLCVANQKCPLFSRTGTDTGTARPQKCAHKSEPSRPYFHSHTRINNARVYERRTLIILQSGALCANASDRASARGRTYLRLRRVSARARARIIIIITIIRELIESQLELCRRARASSGCNLRVHVCVCVYECV